MENTETTETTETEESTPSTLNQIADYFTLERTAELDEIITGYIAEMKCHHSKTLRWQTVIQHH